MVEYTDRSTEIQPALAKSWETSSDGKLWTFHLRPGVKFHDGTPCDAEAVVFNFRRQMDPLNPYHHFGKFIYWQTMWGSFPGKILEVSALDSLTVQFKLASPMAPFLANLAMFPFAISSPTAIKKYGADYFKHPTGTGPFRFVMWQPRERIVLDANSDYWKGKPTIERLIFQPILDDTSRRLQLERGAVDLITGVQPEDAKTLEENQKIRVLKEPGMNVSYLSMNCQTPPFTSPLVRQAIRYAINKKPILKKLYLNFAKSAVGSIPPGVLGYTQNLQDYPYDPEKARKLLGEAGFPHGFSTTLWYLPISRDYMPQPKAIAEAVEANLTAVGINAKLLTFDWGTYLAKTQEGEHAMAFLGWVGDNGDPDNFIYALLDSDNAQKPAQNIAFYKNSDVHSLLKKAQTLLNPTERANLYEQAQQLINRDSPWVPIAYADQIIAEQKHVTQFMLHPTAMLRFRETKVLDLP